ncbi:MAG: hypothetical protein C0475_08695 [Planctomyces sp.]|nr:hypothetical protein [Planctomyces sp.]MBA4039325.1 hypothetical protein [Planctomyces sp.]MBA4120189.1 hypothetical protein [Isosphaera sp.]
MHTGDRAQLAPRLVGLSLIAPAHNEAPNIPELVRRAGQALAATGLSYELVIVDDGSTDGTRAAVTALLPDRPWLRCLAMTRTPRGRGGGQSAAFFAGIRASRGDLIATIDADLQNDPADLADLLRVLRQRDADMVQGDRSHARRDNAVRRVGSIVGRLFRRLLLRDVVRDTGCSLRLMRREVALALPLQFKGMHRFIPITAASLGYQVDQVPVGHAPRTAGVSKYGLGITQRALPGLIDCLAVRWMINRRRPVDSAEIVLPADAPAGTEVLRPTGAPA